MAVRSQALGQGFTNLYDHLWAEAIPVDGPGDHPWDGMLHLMGRGMTMESAATSLGLTPRTGRRRVAEAMDYYGASSHFTLGAAWSKAQ